MKKRPLCFVVFMLLVIQSIRFLMTDRQTLTEVPASSIFYEETTAESVLLCGTVYKKSMDTEYQILYLKNNSITYQNQTYHGAYVIVYEDTFEEIKIGQRVKVQGSLSAFEGARNPGNFDAKLYYAKQKLHGSLWCNQVLAVEGKEHAFQEWLFQVRQQWKERIIGKLGNQQGGILCAMLLGEKSAMDEDIKELYQKNGYGHLLAISGLHISFVGLGVYHFLRKFGLGYAAAGILALSLLSLYVIMLGFSVSIFRAYIMLVLRLGADLSGRIYDMLTAVMLSAGLILLYEPLYLLDAGFQLSHGAILAILFVIPASQELLGKQGKIIETLISGAAINLALAPVTLWYYYEIPTYSILWNLLVIPLMSLLLGLGMMGILLPFAGICLHLCKMILQIYEWIGEFGTRLPCSRLVLGRPSIFAIIFFYVLLFIFVRWNSYVKAHAKMLGIAFAISLVLFVKIPNGTVEITMLDVGQGDCIFVRAPNGENYLVDGGSSDVSQVGKYRIESFLKYKGVGSLDYVFVSHGDLDHCSGIEELIARQNYSVKIKALVLPETYKQDEALTKLGRKAKAAGIKVLCMKQGMCLTQGDFRLCCLQPGQGEASLEGNAASMVLGLEFKEFSMLFTGDVELEGEEHLLSNLKGREYFVLKVAHHGSKNSTASAFLEEIRPQIALISAGQDNSYGHPHRETIERLEAYNCRIFQTAKQGAITLKTDGNSLTF